MEWIGFEDDQKFSHGGRESKFGRFAGATEALIKVGQDRVATTGHQSGLKECDRAVLAFIRHDPSEGDADLFPTCTAHFVAAIAGDAMAGRSIRASFLISKWMSSPGVAR